MANDFDGGSTHTATSAQRVEDCTWGTVLLEAQREIFSTTNALIQLNIRERRMYFTVYMPSVYLRFRYY